MNDIEAADAGLLLHRECFIAAAMRAFAASYTTLELPLLAAKLCEIVNKHVKLS